MIWFGKKRRGPVTLFADPFVARELAQRIATVPAKKYLSEHLETTEWRKVWGHAAESISKKQS